MTAAGRPGQRGGVLRRLVRNILLPLAELAVLVWASQRLGEPLAVGLAVIALGHLLLLSLSVLLRHDVRREERSVGRLRLLGTLWALPKVKVLSWDREAGVVYLVREKLRRDGAGRRDLAHARGDRVCIPMRWGDPHSEWVTSVPDVLAGRFDVVARHGVLTPGADHPKVLGDFEAFWTRVIDAARAGTLEVFRRGSDVCLSTSVVTPPNAQVLVLMSEADWDLVRSCTPSATAPTSAS